MRTAVALTALALTGTLLPARNGIQFNPEPLTGNRALGISVGVVTKQLRQGDVVMPWMYLDRLIDRSGPDQSASLQVGLIWSPEFRYGVGIQTGIYYEMSTQSRDVEGLTATLSDHALSIPLRVQWRYEIVPDWSVFVYTGPSFGIGVAGKMRLSGEVLGQEMSTEDGIYDPEYGYRRFNMYWGVGAGVRWRFLQLRIGGDWGLLNINGNSNLERIVMNKPLHVTLSYMF